MILNEGDDGGRCLPDTLGARPVHVLNRPCCYAHHVCEALQLVRLMIVQSVLGRRDQHQLDAVSGRLCTEVPDGPADVPKPFGGDDDDGEVGSAHGKSERWETLEEAHSQSVPGN